MEPYRFTDADPLSDQRVVDLIIVAGNTRKMLASIQRPQQTVIRAAIEQIDIALSAFGRSNRARIDAFNAKHFNSDDHDCRNCEASDPYHLCDWCYASPDDAPDQHDQLCPVRVVSR